MISTLIFHGKNDPDSHAVFFLLENFRQILTKKNLISTYTKDFSWKNGPISPDFEFFFSKSPDFYDKLQWVAKNIEGFCFSCLVCSQIWFKLFCK
jgi:hypothetical protein